MDDIKNLQMRVAKLERFQEIVTMILIFVGAVVVFSFFRQS